MLSCAAPHPLSLLLFLAGGTLAEFIHKRCNSLLDEDTILHFFVQILLALHHVHTKQILHRDLKTQNILLDKHRMIVKIGDFGISKILSSKSKAYTVSGRGASYPMAAGWKLWIWLTVVSGKLLRAMLLCSLADIFMPEFAVALWAAER